MNGRKQGNVPAQWLERLAAASLGGAAGLAIVELAPWRVTSTFAAAAFGGVALFAITLKMLKWIAADRHPIALFETGAIAEQAVGAGELFLRLQDVLAEASAAERGSAELLLDDALDLPAADSRVSQLFQGAPMPTAGELQARIDRHLERDDGVPPSHADDSRELFEALASLKHSLG